MKQPVNKKKICFILVVYCLFSFCIVNTSYAEEQDDASDENLSYYVDDSDYRIEDGFAIEIATNSVENCRSDARSVTIPQGVEAISSVAFTDCEMLESIIVTEGVKTIGGGAFEGLSHLKSVSLPTTLEEINPYAFFDCDIDTLIIPRNTRLVPNLGQSEWYGVLDGCSVKTLVFCGTDGLFLPTTFGNIVFPADGSGRIVFWGDPPQYIEVSDLQFNYKGGDINSGPFTICYPAQYANTWAPNGETEWNELPIRALTKTEEQQIVQQSPKLFSDEDRTDVTQYPGWSFDQDHNVTIYSEEGWYRYCIKNWEMEINDLRFAEGVEFILEYFNPTSDAGMYPGPSEITMKRLILPKSFDQINLEHMILQEIIVAEDNPFFHMEDGKLIETCSGDVIWPIESNQPNENTSIAEDVSTPAPSATAAPTATASPAATQEAVAAASRTSFAVPLLTGLIVLAVAAIVVVGVLRRQKRKK